MQTSHSLFAAGLPGGALFETWLFLAGKKSVVKLALTSVHKRTKLSQAAAERIWHCQAEHWCLPLFFLVCLVSTSTQAPSLTSVTHAHTPYLHSAPYCNGTLCELQVLFSDQGGVGLNCPEKQKQQEHSTPLPPHTHT